MTVWFQFPSAPRPQGAITFDVVDVERYLSRRAPGCSQSSACAGSTSAAGVTTGAVTRRRAKAAAVPGCRAGRPAAHAAAATSGPRLLAGERQQVRTVAAHAAGQVVQFGQRDELVRVLLGLLQLVEQPQLALHQPVRESCGRVWPPMTT